MQFSKKQRLFRVILDNYIIVQNNRIMGLFGLFKSKKEKFRTHVRACFDESVKDVIIEHGDTINDPMIGGMMVQAAIGSIYQTLKNDPKLSIFANMSNFNPYEIIEEECQRALNKYLE